MQKPNFWGRLQALMSDEKFQALVAEAKTPEEAEGNVLANQIALKAENELLRAQVQELQEKLAQANGTVETAMANVVAERAKLAEERQQFEAEVAAKTAWLNEPAAEPVKVKQGFQPDANVEAEAPLVPKEPWADAVNEYLNQF